MQTLRNWMLVTLTVIGVVAVAVLMNLPGFEPTTAPLFLAIAWIGLQLQGQTRLSPTQTGLVAALGVAGGIGILGFQTALRTIVPWTIFLLIPPFLIEARTKLLRVIPKIS